LGFCCNCGPFPCLCNNDDNEDDSESIELALMGKSEINHSKKKTNSKMIALEAEEQGKSAMDNEGMPMLSNDNYQQ